MKNGLDGQTLKMFFKFYRWDKLPSMSDEEQFKLLASDGMLVKRPILIDGDAVLVGFKEAEWQQALKR